MVARKARLQKAIAASLCSEIMTERHRGLYSVADFEVMCHRRATVPAVTRQLAQNLALCPKYGRRCEDVLISVTLQTLPFQGEAASENTVCRGTLDRGFVGAKPPRARIHQFSFFFFSFFSDARDIIIGLPIAYRNVIGLYGVFRYQDM